MQRETTEPGGASPTGSTFRLAVVPGVTPGKWARVWHERLPDVSLELVHLSAVEALDAVRTGRVEAGLVRMPVDRDVLSAIPLYTETTVVVVPTDHVVTAADEVTTADLVDENRLLPGDDVLTGEPGSGGLSGPPAPEPAGSEAAVSEATASGTTAADTTATRPVVPPPATTSEAVELVAAGVGVLVVPQSLARLHHRRDLTYRPVVDAPTSSVALAWRTEAASDLVEELIGIVRGRTANSSRGRTADPRGAAPSGGRSARPAAGAGARGTGAGRTARAGRPRRPGGRGGTGRAR